MDVTAQLKAGPDSEGPLSESESSSEGVGGSLHLAPGAN
jgi:hypothetical protein